jgi:hypothetical protein
VCDWHRIGGGDKKRGIFSLPSKPVATVWWFDLKTTAMVLVIWALKSLRQFLGLGFKTKGRRFVGCASKPMGGRRRCEDMRRHPSTYFGAKQVALGFLGLGLKTDGGGVCWFMWYHLMECVEATKSPDGWMALWQCSKKSDNSTRMPK